MLPLHRSPDRLSTLHAKGLLSPCPASRQIRRGNPDDGAPRPSRRRLRHLGCAPPRTAALRRLFPRPRISRPAPRQANRGDAAPPPRQRRRRLTARRSEEESLRLFPNVEPPPSLPANREPNRPHRAHGGLRRRRPHRQYGEGRLPRLPVESLDREGRIEPARSAAPSRQGHARQGHNAGVFRGCPTRALL